jgi:hypothetical protein
MGANGSAQVDGRLKSRSQSSSALYCVGKSSGGGNGVDASPSGGPYLNNYGSDVNCYRGNSYNQHPTSNGLSTSIPADIWNLPPTAKSFSPIIQKHHILPPPLAYAAVPNSNNYQLYATNNAMPVVVTQTQQHPQQQHYKNTLKQHQQQQQRPSVVPIPMPSAVVDAFPGRHKKGT